VKKILLLVLVILSTIYLLPHAAASPNAVIQNDSSYVDSAGYFHVVGEVLNTGDVWLEYVEITGTLKNATGQIVDVTFTFTTAHYLPPSQRGPFDLLEADIGKSAKIATYTLALQFQEASTPPQNNLVVENVSTSTDSLGYVNIVGEVKNNGPQVSNYTEVIATFYNSTGKVTHVDFTFTSPEAVPPGQAYGFKLVGPSSSPGQTWTLFAEGTQYTSVPEFPWPVIMLAAALTLGIVTLRKKRT
jgi:uncharacterized protein YxeA